MIKLLNLLLHFIDILTKVILLQKESTYLMLLNIRKESIIKSMNILKTKKLTEQIILI